VVLFAVRASKRRRKADEVFVQDSWVQTSPLFRSLLVLFGCTICVVVSCHQLVAFRTPNSCRLGLRKVLFLTLLRLIGCFIVSSCLPPYPVCLPLWSRHHHESESRFLSVMSIITAFEQGTYRK
ncbi:unnamed protein product, partial [Ectocarpus sp. 12 AP-2014]